MSRVGFSLLVLLCIGVAGYAAIYWLPSSVISLSGPLENGFGALPLAIHAASGSVALVLGPWQFLSGLRARRPRVHRAIGITYMLGCFIGALSGLVLAIGSLAGPVASLGFAGLAIAWLLTTGRGLASARRRDLASHRRWMWRSFALTLAAVTLRLWLPGLAMGGVDFEVGYPLVAWLCWVPNLILAEIYLRVSPGAGRHFAAS